MADKSDKKTSVVDDIIKAGKRGATSVAIVAGSAGFAAAPTAVNAQADMLPEIGKILQQVDQVRRVNPNDPPRQTYNPGNNNRPGNTYPQTQNNQQQAQNNQLQRMENSVTAYSFKTPMSESLGSADLTAGIYVTQNDKRFSPAVKAAYEDMIGSAGLLKNGVIPDGIKKFNANNSLSREERAQVIGLVVASLRADAPIVSNDSAGNQQSAIDIEKRTFEGGKIVALFVRAVPDAKNISYTWNAPDNPFVKRPSLEALASADIRTRGKRMSGNLGAFLASGFQDSRPNSEADALNATYKLYDELMRPAVLKFIDSQIAQPFPGQSR
jgi:hypothetical protein